MITVKIPGIKIKFSLADTFVLANPIRFLHARQAPCILNVDTMRILP